jgi:hypothetical protein
MTNLNASQTCLKVQADQTLLRAGIQIQAVAPAQQFEVSARFLFLELRSLVLGQQLGFLYRRTRLVVQELAARLPLELIAFFFLFLEKSIHVVDRFDLRAAADGIGQSIRDGFLRVVPVEPVSHS